MATTRVSLVEYLDRASRHGFHEEYVDGGIQEKEMGGYVHGAWMVAIGVYFHRHRHEWGIRPASDLHVNTRRSDYRIGDVVLVDRSVPLDAAPLKQTPFAVFEILSPTDTVAATVARLRDYAAMGCEYLYLLNPEDGIFQRYAEGKLTPATDFICQARGIHFPFSEIAQELD